MSISQFNIRKYKINFNYIIVLGFGIFMAVALAPSLAKVVDSHSANAVPPVITNITAGL